MLWGAFRQARAAARSSFTIFHLDLVDITTPILSQHSREETFGIWLLRVIEFHLLSE